MLQISIRIHGCVDNCMCCSCGNAAPCVQVRNHGGGGRIGWPRAPPHSCPRRLSVSSATVGQAGKAVLRTTIRSGCIPFTQSSADCRLLPRVLTAHASCVACFRVPAARRPEVAVRGPQTVICSRLSILEVRCFAVCAAVRHRIAVRSSQLVHSLALRRRGAALQRPRAQGATERPACARKKTFSSLFAGCNAGKWGRGRVSGGWQGVHARDGSNGSPLQHCAASSRRYVPLRTVSHSDCYARAVAGAVAHSARAGVQT